MGVSYGRYFFQSLNGAKKQGVCSTLADTTIMEIIALPVLLARLGLVFGIPMEKWDRFTAVIF